MIGKEHRMILRIDMSTLPFGGNSTPRSFPPFTRALPTVHTCPVRCSIAADPRTIRPACTNTRAAHAALRRGRQPMRLKDTNALPRMARAAGSDTLRTAFEDHLEEAKGHVQRLETVRESLGIAARGGMGRAARGARCAMSPPRAPMAPSLTATCVRRPGRD